VIAADWNALHPGDLVVVHEHADHLAARPRFGVVEFVWVQRPTNAVGIRVTTSTGSRLVWPTHDATHERTLAGAAACHSCSARRHPSMHDPRLN